MKIQSIIVKDPIKWAKGTKSGMRWGIGIQSTDGWVNGNAWTEKDAEYFKGLKSGDEINVILYEEEGTGKYSGQTFKKFRLPTKEDKMLENIVSLGNSLKDHEKRLKALEDELERRVYNLENPDNPISKEEQSIHDSPTPDNLPF